MRRPLVQRWITIAVALLAALVMVAPAMALAFMPRPVATTMAPRSDEKAWDADRPGDERRPVDRPAAPNLDEEEDDHRHHGPAPALEHAANPFIAPAGRGIAPLDGASDGHWTDLDATLRPPRAS